MNIIRHERKNVEGKQKISSKYHKYHQLVEKCNSLHVSIGYAIVIRNGKIV